MKYPYMFQDLQTHTTWSDGDNSVHEMVEQAYNKELHTYGITDHFRSQKLKRGDYVSSTRIPTYKSTIIFFKDQFPSLNLVVGLEIDTTSQGPGLRGMAQDPFTMKNLQQLDYLLMEHVADKQYDEVRKFVADKKGEKKIEELSYMGIDNFLRTIALWRDKGITIPIGLAHNSIDRNLSIPELEKLAAEEIFIELCSDVLDIETGKPFYLNHEYTPKLLHFINAGGKISIGSDAHEVSMVGKVNSAIEYIEKLEIEDSVIEIKPND